MQVERLGNVVQGEVSPRITKHRSNVYSITQSDLLGNSTEKDVHRKRIGRMEVRKCLRKTCCHCIECPAANFLAAFMWRRPLNSAALATTTHRRPERVSDGTCTHVATQMTNKCKIKIVQKKLYNVRDPSWIEDRKIIEESTIVI